MADEENRMHFVRSKLPWIAGVGGLILFLATLNHWVNLRSLPIAAKIAGWEWGLPVQSPLFFLVTSPIRILPGGIQAVAMNVFAALCASLTLALLARSVALLPHDRTHEQRLRERSDFSLLSIGLAWVPVVLAVAVCALQRTFWEHATSLTGEMFDLLLFAYLIRCLLEYRVSMDEGWLSKLAIVYGLGVTNNFALIAFFPLFLGALIWIRGLQFFDPAFLVRMAALGLLGLLLYLVLPLLWQIRHEGNYTFFQLLRANWATQKKFLMDIPMLRNRVLLLSLTSILPVILMGARWPSKSGETSAAGANLTNLAFRVIHIFILAACIFVAFDPKYSPRELGLGVPFLTFYYLGALAIGYYAGYALLVFREPPRKSWRPENPFWKVVNPIVRAAVLAALVAVPAAMAYRNYPKVMAENGTLLKQFAVQMVETLPKAPAYLLSEDGYQLALLQAHLAGAHRAQDYVLVNTRSLEAPDYHEQLHKHWGDRWPMIAPKEELGTRISQLDVQQIILGLATTNSVAYLHPSFGYFFEVLYAQPNGITYPLRRFDPQEVLPPALTPESVRANESFWSSASALLQKLESIKSNESMDARYLSQFYSRALNNWGVQLQRNGEVTGAGKQFAAAFTLNTNNIPARFNAEFNKTFQAGQGSTFEVGKTLEEKFGPYRSWDAMLQENGQFDHPELCAILGDGFLTQTQYRQAALQFSRTAFFQSTNLQARLALAKAFVYGNWVDKGMAEIEKIETEFRDRPQNQKNDIIALKAAAFYQRNDFTEAEKLLQTARAKQPEDTSLGQALFELYRISDKYDLALNIVNQQLQKAPTNIVVLLQKAELQLNHNDMAGAHETVDQVLKLAPKSAAALLFEAFVYIREGKYAQAQADLEKVLIQDPESVQAMLYKGIVLMEQKQTDKAREAFDNVLDKQPDNLAALRNRAILNLRAQQWSAAEDDYSRLRKITPRSHAVMYGLGEIAYAQKNYVDATRFYELYLKYAPADAAGELLEERKKVEERLKELKALKR